MASRPAARRGDKGVPHCSAFTIASGSGDVKINGKPAARDKDKSTLHTKPGKPCKPHTSKIKAKSRTVKINGRPAARLGDPLSGCTKIAQGSGDVRIGG